MFDHHCTACDRRQLIFPSQITGIDNTDHGIVVSFRCWCGAEQTLVTGRGRPPAARHARRLSARRASARRRWSLRVSRPRRLLRILPRVARAHVPGSAPP